MSKYHKQTQELGKINQDKKENTFFGRVSMEKLNNTDSHEIIGKAIKSSMDNFIIHAKA